VLLDGEEFDCRTSGPARLMSVSIERAALDRHARSLLGRHLGELSLCGALKGLRADAVTLRKLFRETSLRAAADPRALRDGALANALEARIVKALLSEFGAPQRGEAPSRSLTLARKAESWLRRNLTEPASIARLCEALDASERTLHEAFREHLGTTPKAYLKTLRLNAARHDLVRALGKTRVTDVALDWGFLHFGWFSQDYRRLFGETPRETLQGRRGEVGGASFDSPRLGDRPRTAEPGW
jgi:AraC-like DNA-binding protein